MRVERKYVSDFLEDPERRRSILHMSRDTMAL